MLKSHQNLLEPRPSDRLRVGECVLDIPLREIVTNAGRGERTRITVKSQGVLLLLAAHAGKVVSREALLEWVWPDTMPTDDVITQAVTQLRKALGDEREHPRYIETIAKQGYRLIAPIEWIEGDDSVAVDVHAENVVPFAQALTDSGAIPGTRMPAVAMHSADSQHHSGQPLFKKAVLLVLAAMIMAGIGGYLYSKFAPQSEASTVPSPKIKTSSPVPAYQRIASMPSGEYRPSLSPDGALVAYVLESPDTETASLMIQTTAAVPPRALTEPVKGDWDIMPVWSADGRQIAFIRQNNKTKRCAVMLIPAAGGGAREVGECLSGYNDVIAWYPDGKALIGSATIFSSPNGAVKKSLYRMPLATGRWEEIRYTRSTSDEDFSPAVSPDGRWIAFQRNVSLSDLWRVPSEGGTPERLTHLRSNFYGLNWTPDGRFLVFGRYVNGKVILGSLEIATGIVREYDGGADSLFYPSVSRTNGFLAFQIEDTVTAIHRIEVETAGGTSPASGKPIASLPSLFESTGSNMHPSIAPDGNQLMFYSDRTGDLRLWWVEQSRPETLRAIDGIIPVARYPVHWDAQSQRVLAIGQGANGTEVYEIEPRRGLLTKLSVPDANPVHVSYHPDPNRMLVVADRGEGRLGVALYDRSTRPWRALARADDVATALVDTRNRRIVLGKMSNQEIWSADLDLGHLQRIDKAGQRRNRTLVDTPDGMWVMDANDDCALYWRQVAVPGRKSRSICLNGGSSAEDLYGFSFDPVRRAVYFSSVDKMNSDIGLLPLSALTGGRVLDRKE